MDIVLIGAGEVGFHLADILSREEHRVSVIDSDPSKARRILESLDVQVVVGDGTRADVLNNAGVSKADLVVAVTDHDLVNMLACNLAKHLGADRVILRLHDTGLLRGYRYFYKRTIGFDVVLSTEELAAEEILNTVREQHALEVESFADGRVQVRRFRIPKTSPLIEVPLMELELPSGVLLGAVSRGEEFFIPTGQDRIEKGDQVYVIGKSGDLDTFETMTGAPTLGRRSVVVLGAGRLGREIAHKLQEASGIALRVIERNPRRAKALAAELSGNVLVLEGDATDLDLLTEERIGEANVFIAATDEDEQNMIVCQLVRSLGVERTIAMVNKASYRQIYDLLGIDQAISPRILCANRILRYVRSSSVSSIAVIASGRAEVLEVEASFSGRKSRRKIKSLDLPRGAVVGALVHEDDVSVPHGESVVESGDHLIVFTLPENIDRILKTFRRSDER